MNNLNMNIVNLPEHLLFFIHSFISSRPDLLHHQRNFEQRPPYWSVEYDAEARTNLNWVDFMNSTVAFHELKGKSLYLALNKSKSLRYLNEINFQEQINGQLLQNCRNQLALQFISEFPWNQSLENLHFLKLKRVSSPIPLRIICKVKILDITECTVDFIADPPEAIESEVLVLIVVHHISFNNIKLPHLHKLYVDHCSSLDLSSIPKRVLEKLDSFGLRFVTTAVNERTDVSTIRKLVLSGDVIMNKVVQDFSSAKEMDITDLGSFRHENQIPTNRLSHLLKLTIQNVIPNFLFSSMSLIFLHISYCPGVRNLNTSIFPSLKELHLDSCYGMESLTVPVESSLQRFCFQGEFPQLKRITMNITVKIMKFYSFYTHRTFVWSGSHVVCRFLEMNNEMKTDVTVPQINHWICRCGIW
jgi:hypothetical protein